MKAILPLMLLCTTLSFAQKTSIDLAAYKNNPGYTMAETTYTVGTHVFNLVNISPKVKGDTACISAVVIDKRKFVLFDIGAQDGPYGLFVPRRQPIRNGLIALKASPLEGKTFLFLSTGKLITLPGAQTLADTLSQLVYCVWKNDKGFSLTLFNYKSMRLAIPTVAIREPLKWYMVDGSYGFSVAGEKGYYTVDLFTKSVVKTDDVSGSPQPLDYLMDLSAVESARCCTAKALRY
jgi:hypothetical protein